MNMKRSILLPLLLAFSGAALAQPAEFSTPIHGIILESTDNLDMTLKLVKSSRKRLTVRLVMDDDDISARKKVVDALAHHVNVMVQILDSEQISNHGMEKIRRRTTRTMNAFGDKVVLREAGNELNGNWVGSSPQEINAKAQAAYEVVKKRNGKTAFTLNHWPSPNCYEKDWETISKYAESLPASLRNVDCTFFSIYETVCTPAQHPSSNDLAGTFNHFKSQFNKATKFGIGEIGTQDESDEQKPATSKEKKRIANYYYGLQQPLYAKMGDRYVGGYFWWYFHRDAALSEVNGGRKNNLWPTLKGLPEQL